MVWIHIHLTSGIIHSIYKITMAILQTVTLILTTNNSLYYDIHLKAHLLDALFVTG